MPDLIAAMRDALAAFSAGEVEQPVRTVLEPGAGNYFAVMPAYMPATPAAGVKLVTVFHENPSKGLPSHLATILLFSTETGALEAILDGRFITEARTAAVSAVSSRLLANEDAQVLAILGSGVQALSHLEALRSVHTFASIRIWSPRHAPAFAEQHGIKAAASAEAAVRGADVVALVTSSPTPVLDAGWVKPGAHVISVGACRPAQREMDPALLAKSKIYVDSLAAAMKESGDIVMGIREGHFPSQRIRGELGELLLGRAEGRLKANEITVFKSLGLAVEDVAAAHLALTRAREQGIGTCI
jgi:ornithine cyclodeaminase/alanine dehydrogenase-like protein (mu-crystallin family)